MVSASVKRNLIEKYSFYSSIQKKTLNLHLTEPVPTGWAGQKFIGICFLCRNWGRVPRRAMEHERTFLDVIFESSNFANLISTRRYRNEASAQGVLYPYACKSTRPAVYIIYNTQRRGLAELLISVEGQCEGLMTGISCRCFSHVFFVSISQVLTLMLKQGEVVGEWICYVNRF